MRNILIICALIIIAGIVWFVTEGKTSNHYGTAFTGAPKAEVAQLLEHPTDYLGKQLTINGQVADQCPTSGCFFYFYVGQKKLKIELGDLAQKIPKQPGAHVIVEGQLLSYGDSYQFVGTAAEFHGK